jgi:hypothetical protein
METISNMATAARNSVFGDSVSKPRPEPEPPAALAADAEKGTVDKSTIDGSTTDQNAADTSTGDKSTTDTPLAHDSSSENRKTADHSDEPAVETFLTPPTPAGDKPDIAKPPTPLKEDPKPTSVPTNTESGTSPTTASKPQAYSHSALFGLACGNNDSSKSKDSKPAPVHPPKDSGEVTGTPEEAGASMAEQVAKEDSRTAAENDDDDSCGYVGLKKAAMEEEEKKQKQIEGGEGSDGSSKWKNIAVEDAEDRNPSMFKPCPI